MIIREALTTRNVASGVVIGIVVAVTLHIIKTYFLKDKPQ